MTYHLAVGVNGNMPNDKCGINQRKRKAKKVRDGATAKRFSSTANYNDSGNISFWPLIKASAFAGIKKHEGIQDGDCIAISECRANDDYFPISLPNIPFP
jgi:hypothetical protein